MTSVPVKRSLRKRKIINYRDVLLGKESEVETPDETHNITSTHDTDISDKDTPYSPESSDENSKELFSTKKSKDVFKSERKTSNKRISEVTDRHLAEVLAENDDSDDANEYRLQRQKQMLDRQMILKSMEFEDDIKELQTLAIPSPVVKKVPTVKKLPSAKRQILTSRRRSARLLNRVSTGQITDDFNSATEQYNQSVSIDIERIEAEEIDENLNFMESEEDREFLSNLNDALNIPYESVCDFTTCDFEKFKATVKLCRMFEEPAKIITGRIVSMDFHPSENKLLILVGDKYGNIALRDLTNYEGIQLKGHQYNTNCIKFSQQNNIKFYSTSLDGTVRLGDINTKILKLLYTSNFHTTWHHESGSTLYVAEGNGAVRLFDIRSPNDNPPTFQCHKRSVRTVQTHPLDENYFLTSSGTGYFGVWDVRHIKEKDPEPLILQQFKNSLTSAFYSARGKYMLATCNDDSIRVFECVDNMSKEISRVAHNNHTGRWLSVFKAMWQPQREDCFYVGSMMQPRRMQAYTEKGVLWREFRSEAMNTVNSVITVHPTKPIIVGGNGSGKIHIFSPFRNLHDI